METVFQSLLLLLIGVWLIAVVLRRLGWPTIMGELLLGVILGPTVLGWLQPSEIIEALAEIGIFFLMLHAGVETEPREFFAALKRSMGVAVIGALAPFSVSLVLALSFGYTFVPAVFIGLTMTATAVVVTLKIFRDLNLCHTAYAQIIIASSVIDNLFTLVFFSIVLGLIQGGQFELITYSIIFAKVIFFFLMFMIFGYFIYPMLTLPFKKKKGKGFTFVLVLGLTGGVVAELMGLHVILGAYLAGLFYEERITTPTLFNTVKDRLYGISYSFLGPIFFISLGFHITFDISSSGWIFLFSLVSAVIIGEIIGAGGMARRLGFTVKESMMVGIGMCGRAEMAFILASLGLSQNMIDESLFSILIFSTFLLNMITPILLKYVASSEQKQKEKNV